MATFNVLEVNQRLMDRMGIYFHTSESANSFNKYTKSFAAHFILLNLLGGSFACAMNVYNSNEFIDKSYALMIHIGMCQSTGIFLNIRLKRKNITDLHHKLQAIVDEGSEDEYIRNIYWSAEQKCREYTRNIAFYFIVYDQTSFVGTLFYSIYYICTGNFDTSTWSMFFDFIVSINTSSIYGWYLSFIITLTLVMSYLLIMIAASTYFMSCCIYIDAICDHFDRLMQLAQNNVKQNLTKKDRKKHKQRSNEIGDQIRAAIQIHVEIYEIFTAMADINGGSIFSLLPPNAIPLGILMYLMEQATSELDIKTMFATVIIFCIVFIWPFFFCTFANSATDRISIIRYAVYDLDWYDFPPELQKYFVLFTVQAQEMLYFTGFSMIRCTLASFGMILRSSLSYYLVFRSISNA